MESSELITTVQFNRRLYGAIRHSMKYWYARIIHGASARRSAAFAAGVSYEEFAQQHDLLHRLAKRKQYWNLRSHGYSSVQACAVLEGRTPGQVRQSRIQASRRYRAKWGGSPTPGSEAWLRRETTRLAGKLGTKGGE